MNDFKQFCTIVFNMLEYLYTDGVCLNIYVTLYRISWAHSMAENQLTAFDASVHQFFMQTITPFLHLAYTEWAKLTVVWPLQLLHDSLLIVPLHLSDPSIRLRECMRHKLIIVERNIPSSRSFFHFSSNFWSRAALRLLFNFFNSICASRSFSVSLKVKADCKKQMVSISGMNNVHYSHGRFAFGRFRSTILFWPLWWRPFVFPLEIELLRGPPAV